MYKCKDCGHLFVKPMTRKLCMEDECGVGSLFNTRTFQNVECCPHCISWNIEELDCDDCEDDYYEEDEYDEEKYMDELRGL